MERNDTLYTVEKHDIERTLDDARLARFWEADYPKSMQSLQDANSIDAIVDVIRLCNLRGGLSGRREMDEWEKKWYELKYIGLVGAAIMVENGEERIDITMNYDNPQEQPELVFVFDTEPKPYRTVTSVWGMKKLIGAEKFEKHFGKIGVSSGL